MIKIEHPNLNSIENEYSKTITSSFLKNIDDVLEVLSLINSPNIIVEKTVKNKVHGLTSAIKSITGIKNLLDSKHPKGDGKMTFDLIFTLNSYKIKTDKRSRCRKTKKYAEIESQIKKLQSFINHNNLFGSKPNELMDLNEELKNELGNLNKRIYNHFFDYNKYYSIINHKIGKTLDLKCCPYCNRNYITYIPDKNKRFIGPTYDHFFSKNRYEFLTLSFYNLIPSCYICNSNLKLNIDFKLETHIHPYLGGFDNEITFDFELSTKSKISFIPKLIAHQSISKQKKERVFGTNLIKNSGSINVFKLEEIYESHGDSIKEIYKKFDKASPHYIGSISKIIDKLKTSEEEFYRFYFRNYYRTKDFNKRPLAKLDRDIYNKLKTISELSIINR
ncbi:hypothetical protein [Flavobacterium pedocola]